MRKLRVGIEGNICRYKHFRVTPVVRNVTTNELKHAEWVQQVLDGATFSLYWVVRGRWFADIGEV